MQAEATARNYGAVLVEVGGVRPAATVQQHDRRVRTLRRWLEEITDDLSLAVGTRKIDSLRFRMRGADREQREREQKHANETVGHLRAAFPGSLSANK